MTTIWEQLLLSWLSCCPVLGMYCNTNWTTSAAEGKDAQPARPGLAVHIPPDPEGLQMQSTSAGRVEIWDCQGLTPLYPALMYQQLDHMPATAHATMLLKMAAVTVWQCVECLKWSQALSATFVLHVSCGSVPTSSKPITCDSRIISLSAVRLWLFLCNQVDAASPRFYAFEAYLHKLLPGTHNLYKCWLAAYP